MSQQTPLTLSRRGWLLSTASAVAYAYAALAVPASAAPRTLRIAAGEADGSSGTMDPALSTADPDAARINLAFERLVVPDENFVPQPQLASGWRSDETGRVWTFELLRGVTFHDGSEMTADDVVFSYRRLLDPAVRSPAASSLSALTAEGVEAVDRYTVRFTLSSPVVEFPLLIANRFTYVVKAGQSSDRLRTRGIGTGPFKVESFTPGEEPSVFVRHDNYRRAGLPKVDRVELRSIPDAAARIAAIRAGQIDLVWDLPRVGLEALEQDPSVAVVRTKAPFVLTMSCWTDTAPYDDVRVRQAMKLTVDRQKMLALVLGGRGQLGNDSPVATWMQYGIDDPIRERDIGKAKALLAEAGHPNGLAVELHTSETTPGFVEMATVFKAMAAEAGIEVNIVQAPADDYWTNIWLKKPFVCSSWSGRAADDALAVAYLSTSEWNETRWKNAEFDAAIADARTTLDEGKRTELYQKAQRILREEGGAIIPMFPDAIGATRASVTGWKLHPQQSTKDFSEVGIG